MIGTSLALAIALLMMASNHPGIETRSLLADNVGIDEDIESEAFEQVNMILKVEQSSYRFGDLQAKLSTSINILRKHLIEIRDLEIACETSRCGGVRGSTIRLMEDLIKFDDFKESEKKIGEEIGAKLELFKELNQSGTMKKEFEQLEELLVLLVTASQESLMQIDNAARNNVDLEQNSTTTIRPEEAAKDNSSSQGWFRSLWSKLFN